MSMQFITSINEQEFREFLKEALREILQGVKQNESPESEILNVQQAALYLKMKINTLYEKTSCKLIPHFKRGNRLYFNKSELEDWIKQGRVSTKQDTETQALNYLMRTEKTKQQLTIKNKKS